MAYTPVSWTGTLTVSGTSITDAGVRTAADSEVLSSDLSTASASDYLETSKKWLGTITYTASGLADFNYGFAKYEDFGNRDFTVSDFEAVGEAAANDSSFDIEVIHHKSTAWAYSAAAFVAGPSAFARMSVDHSTESDVDSGDFFAYKRSNLSESISGSAQEGIVIRVTTGQNNTVQFMDCHIGVTF